jgi:hypothetical protein
MSRVTEINWDVIQKRRDSGESAAAIIKELGISSCTFYTKTSGKGKRSLTKRLATPPGSRFAEYRKKSREARSSADISTMVVELESRRAKLDAAIAVLRELE